MSDPVTKDVVVNNVAPNVVITTAPELLWSAYLGTSSEDFILAVAADVAGNTYATGFTDSATLPRATNVSHGGRDTFVAKIAADGSLQWVTYLGGSGSDGSPKGGISLDPAGNIILCGTTTSADLAGAVNVPIGGTDAFVAKVAPNGELLWTRYVGGSGWEVPEGIGVSEAGDILVGGVTHSGDFDGALNVPNGGSDSFVAKLTSTGDLTWMRYVGGSSTEQGLGFAVDVDGVSYITGFTESGDLPLANNAFHGGGQDVFLAKVSAAGELEWATYLGGSSDEQAYDAAVDSQHRVWVTGYTYSGDFGGATNAWWGGRHAYVARVSASGSLEYARYLGGSGTEDGYGIAIDPVDNIFVRGYTTSTDFAGAQNSFHGSYDAYVTKMTAAGELEWTYFVGGSGGDGGYELAVDGLGNVLVAGWTDSADLEGRINALSGGTDAFITKIVDGSCSAVLTRTEGTAITLHSRVVDPGTLDAFAYGWSVTKDGMPYEPGTPTNQPTFTFTPDDDGTYTVLLTVVDNDGGVGTATVDVLVSNVPPTATLSGEAAVDEGATYTLQLAATDPGADTMVSWHIAWGDGTEDTLPGNSEFATHVFQDGPNTYTISATVTDDDGGVSAPVTKDVVVNALVRRSLSGTVFDDLDNDGMQDADEMGIDGVLIRLQEQVTGQERTALSANGGVFTFNDVIPGTYRLIEDQPDGYLDGKEQSGTWGGTVDSQRDWNEIVDIVFAAGGDDATGYGFAELRPSRMLGLVWEDFNDDGEVNFGEKAIAGVPVRLYGTNDRGEPVDDTMVTDEQGIYEFTDLRPGIYQLTEEQPAGFADGKESVGQVYTPVNHPVNLAGSPGNDTFNIDFAVGTPPVDNWVAGCDAVNFNFGERPLAGQTVHAGQTATIGFWQNKNGQALINSLNGSQNSPQLANWLAATFPNMYGVNAGASDLTGKGNNQVAALYQSLFKRNAKTAPGGPPKLDAQVLALALAVYATNSNLAGNAATQYGFLVTESGVGTATFDIGSANRQAFGLSQTDSTVMTVMDILLATDGQTHLGLLYDRNGDGQIDASERSLRTLANDVYSTINELGHI